MNRALAAAALLALLTGGCGGDGSGCGSPESGKTSGGGGRSYSGKAPSAGGRAEGVKVADARGRVPGEFRRQSAEADGEKDEVKEPKTKSLGTAPSGGPATARVIQRKVGGAADRVEVFCPVPMPPPGKCLEGPHFSDMKETCCPDGIIEKCIEGSTGGLHIIGRGCGPAAPRN